jgi:TetR/AcrR family transcriptional repressor of nem operon
MRKSREEAAQTRRRIVEAASTRFREHGIEATGLADLMAAAGMTHGGFYKHFDSKDQVVMESVTLALEEMVDGLARTLKAAPGRRGLNMAIGEYLSTDHCNDAAGGCPLAALAGDMARGSDRVRRAATLGFQKMVDLIAGALDGLTPAAAHKEALGMISTMIGAVTTARAIDDPELSAAILRQARKQLIR